MHLIAVFWLRYGSHGLRKPANILKTGKGVHRDDFVVIFVADVSCLPCFFCFLLDIFSRIYLFVVFGPSQGRTCFGKRRAIVGMNDFDYRFLDICVGWLGKVHDARVFKNSPLFALC